MADEATQEEEQEAPKDFTYTDAVEWIKNLGQTVAYVGEALHYVMEGDATLDPLIAARKRVGRKLLKLMERLTAELESCIPTETEED